MQELQAQVRTIEDESRDKSGMNRQVADLLGYQRAKAQQATMGAQLDGINAQMGQVGARGVLGALRCGVEGCVCGGQALQWSGFHHTTASFFHTKEVAPPLQWRALPGRR